MCTFPAVLYALTHALLTTVRNYPLYTVHYTHFISVLAFYTATDMFRASGFVFRDFKLNYISQ